MKCAECKKNINAQEMRSAEIESDSQGRMKSARHKRCANTRREKDSHTLLSDRPTAYTIDSMYANADDLARGATPVNTLKEDVQRQREEEILKQRQKEIAEQRELEEAPKRFDDWRGGASTEV